MSLAIVLVLMGLVVGASAASSQNSQIGNLVEDILALGTEDIKWREYGEFGLFFAPAEYMAELAGFETELHYVHTEDGYLIELVHIINPLADRSRLKPLPVILGHGYSQGTYNFVAQSVNRSKAMKWPRPMSDRWHRETDRNLGFLLANHGYDVWLAGSRAGLANTKQELKLHTQHSIHDYKFWDFTLDDQARFDIPAQIDGVRELTGCKKVIFVGYSQSTFTVLGHLSLFPEFGEKIHTLVLVAPITSMKHGTGILRPIGAVARTFFPEALSSFSAPPIQFGRIVTKLVFLLYSIVPKIVYRVVAFIFNLCFGNNGGTAFDGMLLIGRLFRYPTSFKAFLHFMQLLTNEHMSFYDYGLQGNLHHYGNMKPPIYNLSNIVHNGMAFYIGENDCLSDLADNAALVKSLRYPPVEYKVIPVWNHVDYVFGKNMDLMMNRPLLRLLDRRMAIF